MHPRKDRCPRCKVMPMKKFCDKGLLTAAKAYSSIRGGLIRVEEEGHWPGDGQDDEDGMEDFEKVESAQIRKPVAKLSTLLSSTTPKVVLEKLGDAGFDAFHVKAKFKRGQYALLYNKFVSVNNDALLLQEEQRPAESTCRKRAIEETLKDLAPSAMHPATKVSGRGSADDSNFDSLSVGASSDVRHASHGALPASAVYSSELDSIFSSTYRRRRLSVSPSIA